MVVVAIAPVPFPVSSVPDAMFPHPVPPPCAVRTPERFGVSVIVPEETSAVRVSVSPLEDALEVAMRMVVAVVVPMPLPRPVMPVLAMVTVVVAPL